MNRDQAQEQTNSHTYHEKWGQFPGTASFRLRTHRKEGRQHKNILAHINTHWMREAMKHAKK